MLSKGIASDETMPRIAEDVGKKKYSRRGAKVIIDNYTQAIAIPASSVDRCTFKAAILMLHAISLVFVLLIGIMYISLASDAVSGYKSIVQVPPKGLALVWGSLYFLLATMHFFGSLQFISNTKRGVMLMKTKVLSSGRCKRVMCIQSTREEELISEQVRSNRDKRQSSNVAAVASTEQCSTRLPEGLVKRQSRKQLRVLSDLWADLFSNSYGGIFGIHGQAFEYRLMS